MLQRPLVLLLLSLLLCACRLPAAPHRALPATPGPTGIQGKVTNPEGLPAIGAAVYVYRSPKGGLRGPADFEAIVANDGSYFLDLVEGNYYLAARLRRSGGDTGPPRPGDAWAVFGNNPVLVTSGMTVQVDLVLRGITSPMLLREGSLSSGDTGLSGRIVDEEGEAVAGAITLAYRTPDFRRMPDFTAAATGADGRFLLYLPQGGTFCLAARTKTRGQPQAGELYGTLADGEAGCRTLKNGEFLEVGTITLHPYRH